MDSETHLQSPNSVQSSNPARVFACGLALGVAGVLVSLVFNIVGAIVAGLDPLHLLRVYLTFPLGGTVLNESAIRPDNAFLLGVSFSLYLVTGMLLGALFHLFLTRWLVRPTFTRRFLGATTLSLAVWVLTFYVTLSWLQPLLTGGSWIVEQIPWYVGALTNLAFGWTILLLPDLWAFATQKRSEKIPTPTTTATNAGVFV
jgi:hypothetical protein